MIRPANVYSAISALELSKSLRPHRVANAFDDAVKSLRLPTGWKMDALRSVYQQDHSIFSNMSTCEAAGKNRRHASEKPRQSVFLEKVILLRQIHTIQLLTLPKLKVRDRAHFNHVS